jgi:hypothetical protein
MNGYGCRADKIYEVERVCLSKYPMITICYLKRMSMNFRNMFFFLYVLFIKWPSRNTEGAIKNGQSRETGNIGYTRRKQALDTTMRKHTHIT